MKLIPVIKVGKILYIIKKKGLPWESFLAIKNDKYQENTENA